MSKPKLAAVNLGEDAPEDWFANQARAVLTKALAQRPTALMLVWETAEGAFEQATVPRSDALAYGMIDIMYQATNAPPDADG